MKSVRIQSFSGPYLVRMQENTDQKNSEYVHFLHSECGFRQGYTTQKCLLVLVEKWRQCLDNRGVRVALLADLSKAFY